MSTRLDRIFIRAQNKEGKWVNKSLAELNNEEFSTWYGKWLMRAFQDNRIPMIELLDDLGIPPVELKEGYDADD